MLSGEYTGLPAASVRCTVANVRAVPSPSPRPSPTFPPEAVYPGFEPSGASFWDGRHGLIVGGLAKGVPYGDCYSCRGLMASTSDGGRSWRVVHPLGSPWPTSVVTGPPGDAWVTLADCWYCNNVALLRTTDGGRHWKLVRVGLRSLSFPTATDGWAVAMQQDPFQSPGTIEHSTDGGRTWAPVRVPCPRGLGGPEALSFPTSMMGWAVCIGQPGAGNQEKAIIETRNAGASWSVVADASFSGIKHGSSGGLSQSGYPTGIDFLPEGRGWLYGDLVWNDVGYPTTLRLVETTDGGMSWRVLQSWNVSG